MVFNKLVKIPASIMASATPLDRKSTRLNSSHLVISYAVFCLKKKKKYTSNVHPAHQSKLGQRTQYRHRTSLLHCPILMHQRAHQIVLTTLSLIFTNAYNTD